MIIFIDQDNTLTDFVTSTVKYVKKVYDLEVDGFGQKDCKVYHVLQNMFPYFSKKKLDEMTDEIFCEEGFWIDMPIQPDAKETMEYLCKKHEVYILTAPWPTSRSCIPEKIQWVEMYLPFFDLRNMIFCNNKKLLHGDIILEDSPYFLNNNSCKHRLIYDQPYNRDFEGFRAHNWKEVKEFFEKELWWPTTTTTTFLNLNLEKVDTSNESIKV